MMPIRRAVEPEDELLKCLDRVKGKKSSATIHEQWKAFRSSKCGQVWFTHMSLFQHRRCCYCDSAPARTIDHVDAKATFDLAFKWTNWVCTCGDCNRLKGTRFCIDPRAGDPRRFLAIDPMTGEVDVRGGLGRRLALRAQNTVNMGLSHQVLNDARRRVALDVVTWVRRVLSGDVYWRGRLEKATEPESPHRAVIRDLILEEDDALNPFAPLLKKFVLAYPEFMDWARRPLIDIKHHYQSRTAPRPTTKSEAKRSVKKMVAWFFERYEDPANGVPYDGREGGYQYVNGGPFDAREVLSDEFSDGTERTERIIDDAASQIEADGAEWVEVGSY